MKNVIMMWGVLFAVLWSSAVDASEPRVFAWSDVLERIDRHPALAVAQDEVLVAEGEVDLQGQYPNPEVSLIAGREVAKEGNESAVIWGVEVEVPLRSPAAFSSNKRAARAEREAARFDADAMRIETIVRLRALFLRVGLAQERVRVLETSLAQLDRLVEVAGVRVDKGVARPQELTRMEIEREKLRVELNGAQESVGLGRRKLALWLGMEPSGELVVDARLHELKELPALDGAIARAKESHPVLRAAAQRKKGAAAQVKAEKGARFPEMSVGGFFESELDANMMGAALSVSLPVWNWNSGGVAKAKAEELRTRHEAALIAIELESAMRDAHVAAKKARVRAKAYKDVIVPKEKSTLDALEQIYKIGEMGVMDILYSRQSRLDTEMEMLEALYEAQLARSELVLLIGANENVEN